jgi:tryptophan synthase beta chain
MAPLISYLMNKKYMRSIAYNQSEIFEVTKILARTERLVPAPETSHATKCAIHEALVCKTTGDAKVIAFNITGPEQSACRVGKRSIERAVWSSQSCWMALG